MRLNSPLILILMGAAPFFFLGGPTYHSSQSHKAAWDLGHILFFSIATILLYRSLRSKKTGWSERNVLVVLFFCILGLGITVELLQMLTSGRQPDPFDVARNQIGCLAGFALVTLGSNVSWLKPYRCVVAVGLLIACWPLARSLMDEQIAQAQFPVLANFETPFERLRWVSPKQLKIEKGRASNGKRAMRVQLSTSQYSGTSLFYFPGDWTGYRVLHFDVYNPREEELTLHCRIHDKHHWKSRGVFADRFHQKFRLMQGWNTFQIDLSAVKEAPATRTMDMQQIESFGLFVIKQSQPHTIYIDNVYLSR